MKKFGINCQLRNKLFSIVIHRFSLVKAAMNAPHLCKLRKDRLTGISHGVYKTPQFLNFPVAKDGKRPLRLVNWLSIGNLKTRRHSNTLKGSQRTGSGQNSVEKSPRLSI
jgi:hypothetical protein